MACPIKDIVCIVCIVIALWRFDFNFRLLLTLNSKHFKCSLGEQTLKLWCNKENQQPKLMNHIVKGIFFGTGMSQVCDCIMDKMPWTHTINEIIHNMNFMLNVEPAIGKYFQCFPFHQHNVREFWPQCHDWFMGGFSFATMNYSAEFQKNFFFSREIFQRYQSFGIFRSSVSLPHLHCVFASIQLVKYLTKKYIWKRMAFIHFDQKQKI